MESSMQVIEFPTYVRELRLSDFKSIINAVNNVIDYLLSKITEEINNLSSGKFRNPDCLLNDLQKYKDILRSSYQLKDLMMDKVHSLEPIDSSIPW